MCLCSPLPTISEHVLLWPATAFCYPAPEFQGLPVVELLYFLRSLKLIVRCPHLRGRRSSFRLWSIDLRKTLFPALSGRPDPTGPLVYSSLFSLKSVRAARSFPSFIADQTPQRFLATWIHPFPPRDKSVALVVIFRIRPRLPPTQYSPSNLSPRLVDFDFSTRFPRLCDETSPLHFLMLALLIPRWLLILFSKPNFIRVFCPFHREYRCSWIFPRFPFFMSSL